MSYFRYSVNKIKNWFKDINHLDMTMSDGVNIDIARTNYKKYQDDVEQQRKKYIKALCNEIKAKSRNGYKSITTYDEYYDFMSYEFLMELKEYFKQRGFEVEVEQSYYGLRKSWLIISWL